MANEPLLDFYQGQQINIGGENRYIATYDDITKLEPADIKTGLGGITKEEYQSMICWNLGFTYRPSSDEWLAQSVSLENSTRSEPVELPKYLQHKELIVRDNMSLLDVLTSLYYWGRGPIETGLIVDVEKSWQYPTDDEIKYYLQNKIFIKRTCELSQQKYYWPNTYILMRRLHNLCPHIDSEYFSNCIVNFNGYAAMIPLKDPVSVFVCGIVNPDLLLNIIRESEKKAASIINEKYHGYISLRPDYDTAIQFYRILIAKLAGLSKIFREQGARGIIAKVYQPSIKPEKLKEVAVSVAIDKPDTETDRLTQLPTQEEKRQYIENVELNETNLGFLFRYLDQSSIPDSLTKVEQHKEGDKLITINNPQYEKFIKRAYCIFESISTNRRYWLDDSTKWIFSKPFYGSANKFALYNQKLELFIVAYPDLTYSLENAQEAIRIYKERYDDDIVLLSEEIGDSRETPKVPEVALEVQS